MASDKIIGVHLDLKYTMPKKEYLLDWLRRLPGYGINAILLEYEDKFPFEKYPFLRAPDAFTPDELRLFLETARGAGLQVIPLVQTLSHLEFALGHEELAHLREAPDMPTQICPSNPEAVAFVKDFVREVLAYHDPDPIFHLGADEAWHLGTCPECAAWRERDGVVAMWCEHEKKIMEVVREAGKRPLFWDDIFWKEPELIRESGLSKDVMLHAWNYNVTSLEESAGDSTDMELGGSGGVLRTVDVYRAEGYESLAAPCLNVGSQMPGIEHALKNTAAWALKIQRADMAGMLNTNWSVFHTPLAVLNMLVAATGRLVADPDAPVDEAWQTQWLADEFGAPADAVPPALWALGQGMRVAMEDLGRSFMPIVYAYTNLVLHYPGAQTERRKRGAYPIDWNEVDFPGVYMKGIERARTAPDRDDLCARADELIAVFGSAVEPLRKFAAAATKHADEAALFLLFAEMKLLSARIFNYLVRNDGNVEALRQEIDAQRPRLEGALAPFFEPRGVERLVRAWWEPPYVALGGKL